MSLNPDTQNTENLGNSAKTLRLIFRALDSKFLAHESLGKTRLFRPRPAPHPVALAAPRLAFLDVFSDSTRATSDPQFCTHLEN